MDTLELHKAADLNKGNRILIYDLPINALIFINFNREGCIRNKVEFCKLFSISLKKGEKEENCVEVTCRLYITPKCNECGVVSQGWLN